MQLKQSPSMMQRNIKMTKTIDEVTITQHFKRHEFDCHDGTIVPDCYIHNLRVLCDQLEILRAILHRPIIINSGYRTEDYNKRIGGSPNSQHLLAKAADIRVTGISPHQLSTIIEELINKKSMLEGGLGVYLTFVHYDIRGKKARW